MGRALYSEKYGVNALPVKIHLQPDLPPAQQPAERFTKWSLSNRFDPDSDEFFEDAEYEAFMDQGPLDLPMPHPASSDSSGSSSSSEDGDGASASGRDSPNPAVRMSAIWDRLLDEEAAAAEYTPVPEEQLLLDIPGYSDRVYVHADDAPPRALTVSVHQPSALRNSTTATDLAATDLAATATDLASAPIAIPRAASPPHPELESSPMLSVSPFSAFSASPSTPPSSHARMHFELTPSPPPTVTPRIYMWGTHLASPASPTNARRTHQALARSIAAPALRRVNEPIA